MAFTSEVSAKLTADNTDFKLKLNDAANHAGEVAATMAHKVGDKLAGMKDMSNAVATALGVNFETIAENVARFIVGMSKEEEEALKKLEDVSTRVADANIKNMRGSLSDEQRYQLALKERDSLLRKVEESNSAINRQTVSTLDLTGKVTIKYVEQAQSAEMILKTKEAELKLAEKNAEIVEFEAKRKTEAAQAAKKDIEDISKLEYDTEEAKRKVRMETMSLYNQELEIRGDINDLQELLTDGSLEESKVQETRTHLLDRQKELAEVLIKESEAQKKNDEASLDAALKEADTKRESLSLSEQKRAVSDEIRKLERTIIEGETDGLDVSKQINRQAQLRIELSKLAKTEAEANVEIAKLLLKGEANLTEEEKLRLSVLKGQTTQLKINAEIADLTAKITNGTITPAEKQRLAVLTQQTDEYKKQQDELLKLQAITVSISRAGANYDEQSTVALQGTRARLKSRIDARGETPFAGTSQNWDIYGAFLNNQALKLEIANIEEVLAKRSEIQGYAARFGDSAARYRYGDEMTDKAVRETRDSSQQAATALIDIQQKLNALLK